MSFWIVPAIDIIDGCCVRLQQGDYARKTVYDCSPVETARRWESGGASLIHLVDLDGAKAGHPVNLATVREVCAASGCACELGGGIRTAADIREALAAGVSRVILGTALCEKPDWAKALLAEFGPERLVAGIDARDGKVALRGWLEDSAVDAVGLARELVGRGIRHIIYTDIARDGMGTGPNTLTTGALCDAVPEATVLASGGVGSVDHVRGLVALNRANLGGVVVGKALYDGRVRFAQLREAACA